MNRDGFLTLARYINLEKRIMSQYETPEAPTCPKPRSADARLEQALQAQARAAEHVAEARAALAAKAEADAQQAERDAVQARIREDQRLAEATLILLDRLADLLVQGYPASPVSAVLAKYRKQLQPLAESYGARIVLVGDKTQATVVLL